ncbi:unannotated protein [freshwater metagenome]|uniref:Unannotated protein n=1 Tax=freshwater metagenome TaxID=449393 RepID=A0A6J7S0U4_9ZZZZ
MMGPITTTIIIKPRRDDFFLPGRAVRVGEDRLAIQPTLERVSTKKSARYATVWPLKIAFSA